MTKKFKDAAVRLVNSGSSCLKIYRDAGNNDGRAEDQNDATSEENDRDDDKDNGMRSTIPMRHLGEGPP